MCHLNFCLTLLSVVTQTNKQTGVGGGGGGGGARGGGGRSTQQGFI